MGERRDQGTAPPRQTPARGGVLPAMHGGRGYGPFGVKRVSMSRVAKDQNTTEIERGGYTGPGGPGRTENRRGRSKAGGADGGQGGYPGPTDVDGPTGGAQNETIIENQKP